MFVPFLTKRSERRRLERRKGGGGGGKGGGGGAKGGSKGGGSTATSGSSSSGGRSSTIGVPGGSKSASPYSQGGGPISTIPAGSLFAGRSMGGGTRSQVMGTRTYGSGYPGDASRGVANKGFPFFFWPVVFPIGAGAGAGAYLHSSEYGNPDNSSRPGGPEVTAVFVSSGNANTRFYLVADNETVVDLQSDISDNCGSSINVEASSAIPFAYNNTPQPESAIQYYRASSVMLALDGYNNSAATGPEGTPDTPLPTGIDTDLLNCLNQTINDAVPLVDGAFPLAAASRLILLVVVSSLWWLLSI